MKATFCGDSYNSFCLKQLNLNFHCHPYALVIIFLLFILLWVLISYLNHFILTFRLFLPCQFQNMLVPQPILVGIRSCLIKISVLHNSGTWELVPLSFGKFVVGCRQIFAIKVSLNGTIDRVKACLMDKGYTQIFCSHYDDTFSPVVKVVHVCLFIVMVAFQR